MLGELLQAGRITRARENRPHAELCQRRRGGNDIDHDGEAARGSPARLRASANARRISGPSPVGRRAREGARPQEGALEAERPRGIGGENIIFATQ